MKSVEQRVQAMRDAYENATEDRAPIIMNELSSLTPEEEAEDMYREIQAMAIVNGVSLEEMLKRCEKTVKAFRIDEYCLQSKTR